MEAWAEQAVGPTDISFSLCYYYVIVMLPRLEASPTQHQRFWSSKFYKVPSIDLYDLVQNVDECQTHTMTLLIRLYADNGDDHHASLQGSYLSALTHYLAMFSTEVVIVVVIIIVELRSRSRSGEGQVKVR